MDEREINHEIVKSLQDQLESMETLDSMKEDNNLGQFDLYSFQDIEEAIKGCNFEKAIGPDGFDGRALARDETLRRKVAAEIAEALNKNEIPNYI